MSAPPSPNGSNGQRDAGGRFTKGNPGGPGNPYGEQMARYRSMLHEAVTDEDFRDIVKVLVKHAKEGDITAGTDIF